MKIKAKNPIAIFKKFNFSIEGITKYCKENNINTDTLEKFTKSVKGTYIQMEESDEILDFIVNSCVEAGENAICTQDGYLSEEEKAKKGLVRNFDFLLDYKLGKTLNIKDPGMIYLGINTEPKVYGIKGDLRTINYLGDEGSFNLYNFVDEGSAIVTWDNDNEKTVVTITPEQAKINVREKGEVGTETIMSIDEIQ